MLIEIHMLKNYPPVNLNRDDSGAPKSCFFGGVQRSRLSSQCLKRSWRVSEIFESLESTGVRTRHMPTLVGEKLAQMGVEKAFVDSGLPFRVDVMDWAKLPESLQKQIKKEYKTIIINT